MSAGPLFFPFVTPSIWVASCVRKQAAFAANVGPISLGALRSPAGMYRVDFTLVATVLATLAANTTFSVTATDAAGAFTNPVPLIADNAGVYAASFNLGAGGVKRASGSYTFQSTGPLVDISFTIGGITTPGPLAAVYNVVLSSLSPP